MSRDPSQARNPIPRTAAAEQWQDDPLRTFVEYVVKLDDPRSAGLRRTVALGDLVRMGRNALAADDVNRIRRNKRDARKA